MSSVDKFSNSSQQILHKLGDGGSKAIISTAYVPKTSVTEIAISE